MPLLYCQNYFSHNVKIIQTGLLKLIHDWIPSLAILWRKISRIKISTWVHEWPLYARISQSCNDQISPNRGESSSSSSILCPANQQRIYKRAYSYILQSSSLSHFPNKFLHWQHQRVRHSSWRPIFTFRQHRYWHHDMHVFIRRWIINPQ